MRRLIHAVVGAAAVALAGVAFAQTKLALPAKPVTDYKAVQEHLYALNFNVGERNGQLTPQLRSAIANWRKGRNSTASGDMTEGEAATLLAIVPPKIWGAVSFSATGAHGLAVNKPTREAAEKDVLAACEKINRKCSVATAFGSGCAAVVTSSGIVDGKPVGGAWSSYHPKLAGAKDAAVALCKKNAQHPEACAVQESVCADGSGKG